MLGAAAKNRRRSQESEELHALLSTSHLHSKTTKSIFAGQHAQCH
jgi:hypothetical protein